MHWKSATSLHQSVAGYMFFKRLMIMALTLVENLRLGGLDFIFKGGTSLLLLLGTPQRFSM